MSKLAERYEQMSPHIRALSMQATEVGDGVVVMTLPYQKALIGDPISGILHGGAVTTLIDSAGGLAVLAAMAEPGPIATLDLRIDYLRPATPGNDLLARAVCYRMTRSIAFVRISAWHAESGEEKPVAAAQATFMIKGSGGGLAADRRPA